MSYLTIEHNYVDLPDDFNWDDWVAEMMWKEIRPDGREVVYAFIRRMYDKKELDAGNMKSDEYYIGRTVEYKSKPKIDHDPKSKTYGKRIRPPIQYDIFQEWNNKTNKYDEIKIPRDVEKSFKFVHESKEYLKKYEQLVGRINTDKSTSFVFVYGSRPVSVDQKTFFAVKVSDFAEAEQKKDSIYDTLQEKQSKGKTT